MEEEYEIPESDEALLKECDVQVFRSSGPGGQSVNTTDSAVRLIHRPSGVTVKCQKERSQLRNKRTCLKRLRKRLEEVQHVDPNRIPTRPSRAAKSRRRDAKGYTAKKKQMRRPPSADE